MLAEFLHLANYQPGETAVLPSPLLRDHSRSKVAAVWSGDGLFGMLAQPQAQPYLGLLAAGSGSETGFLLEDDPGQLLFSGPGCLA